MDPSSALQLAAVILATLIGAVLSVVGALWAWNKLNSESALNFINTAAAADERSKLLLDRVIHLETRMRVVEFWAGKNVAIMVEAGLDPVPFSEVEKEFTQIYGDPPVFPTDA